MKGYKKNSQTRIDYHYVPGMPCNTKDRLHSVFEGEAHCFRCGLKFPKPKVKGPSGVQRPPGQGKRRRSAGAKKERKEKQAKLQAKRDKWTEKYGEKEEQ